MISLLHSLLHSLPHSLVHNERARREELSLHAARPMARGARPQPTCSCPSTDLTSLTAPPRSPASRPYVHKARVSSRRAAPPLPQHPRQQRARCSQFHDSAKLSSGSSKVDKPPKKESCEMLLDGLPANLVRTLPKPDPAQHHLLAVRVKQDDALTKCLDSADMGPKPGLLGHPIAAGDWHGVLCTVAPAPDSPEDLPEVFQLYGKVTWGELLEHLYHLWPPGDCRDLAEEDDYEPTLYYFYYDVEISFLKGEQVV